MTRRVWFVLMAALGLVAALGVVKTVQIRAAIAQASSFQMPPEAVTTVKARLEPWPATLDAIGTVQAVRGVTVSADLPGVVEAILFESGQAVRTGEVLVRLDARQERAQLAAAEAQRDLAKLSLERVRGLVAQGILAQAELDRAAAEHKQAEARVGEIAATIDRKQVRAPFSGVLGIRQVDLGQYLAGGAPIVSLQALDPLHVDFSVPQQQVGRLRPGGAIAVSLEGAPGLAQGEINALDAVVDEATRNVRVQATIANPDGRLRPGMFVQVQARMGQQKPVVALPASAISYAPYGDSVYVVVADMEGQGGARYKGVRQQFVKLGPARGDQVAVLEGLEAGAEVVSSGAFKLRNGVAVQVNNEVRPADNPAPRPEDN